MIRLRTGFIFRPLLFMFLVIFLFPAKSASAGEFDNAYTFYTKHGGSNEPAYMNSKDGYVYFCSWGSKSTTSTKYRTVGYTITINVSGFSDSIEVMLGGSIVKNVSTVTKNDVTYVLRKARLSRLQELFFGNSRITWKDIFRKTNTYSFDAIMTVVESGKELCGSVTENSNKRKLIAGHEAYLYRTLSGIKSARNWKNPNDLNNFYGRKVKLSPVSPLVVDPVNIGGGNIYYNGGKWYVKKDSVFRLGINSRFNDMEAVSSRYHPNYNVYKFSGWGDNQKYYVSQGTGGSDRGAAGVLSNGNSANKPVAYKGIDYSATTTYAVNSTCFTSTVEYYMKAPGGETVYATPEGRVYYNNLYPGSDDDDDNLCDQQSNSGGKITLVSDSAGPGIDCPSYIKGYNNSNYSFPVSVYDYHSGINVIRVYRNDGVMVYEKKLSSYTYYYNIFSECNIVISEGQSFYVYAADNVGNESFSAWFEVNVPKAHTVNASISGGYNSFNKSVIDVSVFGGNSEINSLVIMSEDDNNASGERIVITNKSVEAKTLEKGLFKYNYSVDVMDKIRTLPDGKYIFDVISGGRYVQSNSVSLVMIKDITPPELTCQNYTKTDCGWFRSNALIIINAQDNLSGIQSLECMCNHEAIEGNRTYDSKNNIEKLSFKINTEGEHEIVLSASDQAGNRSGFTDIIKIDSSAPEYSLYGGLAGTDTDDGKWIGKNQLNGGIVLTDRYSGIVVAKKNAPLLKSEVYELVEFPFQYYDITQTDNNNAVIKFTDEYINSVRTSKNIFFIDLKDRVGNRLKQRLNVNVDCDAPELTYPADNPWDKNTYKGNIGVSDIHSGISLVQVMKNNELLDTYSFEASHNEKIYLNLEEYAEECDSVSVILTDMVGNSREYPLECDDAKKRERILRSIRTRIR